MLGRRIALIIALSLAVVVKQARHVVRVDTWLCEAVEWNDTLIDSIAWHAQRTRARVGTLV